ncbi:MAG: menaquinone biosynthesis protein [Desulfofustis sp.]|nr:menaquinone biosynthesis protein [Desulfofustis sp.]RZW24437.1 MAG: ABC transporter substrate-binding protein [Desulfobulbaceae bacterium]
MRTPPAVRIGMVNYINTAPIHEIWKSRPHDDSWRMVEAHPAALNQMLAGGEIDLGFVSSHEYGIRPEKYEILEDLSISAHGPVGSVFLFSMIKPEMLSGLRVLLSVQSKTSVCLVKIALEKFLKVSPAYIEGEVRQARKLGADAVLAIGDDALRLNIEGSYQYCLDLGELWRRYTGLPFVFAVCGVRSEFARNHPELVNAVHRELIVCRDLGLGALDNICRLAAPRIPMDVDVCHRYLSAIEFNLGPFKQQALQRFYTYLFEFDEARKECLPLKIRKVEE